MMGVIPAAGKGTRLGGNKPLRDVGDRPLIHNALSLIRAHGIKETVIVQHESELSEALGGDYNGMSLYYVGQKDRAGIANALYQAKDVTKDHSILMVLGDVVYDGDLHNMLTVFPNEGLDAVVGGKPLNYLEKKEISKSYGMDERGRFIEKPTHLGDMQPWLGYGIYMFKPVVYKAIEEAETGDITKVLNHMRAGAVNLYGRYWNVNTKEELEDVRRNT